MKHANLISDHDIEPYHKINRRDLFRMVDKPTNLNYLKNQINEIVSKPTGPLILSSSDKWER